MIEIVDLCKKFEENVLFDHFHAIIQDGEFVIFDGKSGSGKTTLLNMIGALEKVDQGSILVNGKDIAIRKNQREYLQKEAGFLFQNFALVEGKTVRKNLEMVHKRIRSDLALEETLDYVGLLDKIDTLVYKLSGGEQQRVALARLLLKRCSIILADEPTGSLDRENADKVIKLLQQLNGLGKTVIMVTHVEEYKTIGSQSIHIGQ